MAAGLGEFSRKVNFHGKIAAPLRGAQGLLASFPRAFALGYSRSVPPGRMAGLGEFSRKVNFHGKIAVTLRGAGDLLMLGFSGLRPGLFSFGPYGTDCRRTWWSFESSQSKSNRRFFVRRGGLRMTTSISDN
jgi:hypothetical protein